MTPTLRSVVATTLACFILAACEPLDTSPLQDIEEAAEAAQASAEDLNSRASEIQGAIDDPVGALRTAALGAGFTKTPTAEANLFVLTDLQTGCQWLATYGPDNRAVSLVPRTKPSGADTRQRCISIGAVGEGSQ
ncbi:hypothetical protein E4M02_01330 [Brevundimonas sp. S30B]|uniref:hypothetical protein n=1 Tax=unclassified Brevundimonas TaxID=2622653 RepID=UPI00107299D2|nr:MULTISPECIES: hypothetical protein [unclassified Brevundimonas]QBX37446.1 hypothetical protein E4M01_06490 [Brevundimonas sp. MF30-B]TFW03761.1 hypothetical protein E4M02_01330 [Brevundimonas sp. S30B]